jgi:ribose/xylose/arabinose/galactoside ABC-type transport system permease subunit/ABC-type sugar transport system substrate-binding protein
MNDQFSNRLQDRVFTLGITLVILCILTSLVFPETFPTRDNFSQILLNVSIDAIVAVGMMVLMMGGMFDLSVGSVVALSGGLAGYLMYYHNTNFIVAIAAGLIAALLVGFINGLLITKWRINPMIQTLALMGIVRGITLMLSGAGLQNFPYEYIYLGQSKLLKLQAPVWWMIIIVLLFSFLVERTIFFRRFYYIGGNERAAKLSGIDIDKMKIFAFVLSAFLAGLAGILLSSRLDAALSSSGRGLELRVITAVILGGASLSGGQGKIWGAFFGSIFMAIVNNILILSRVSGYWQEVILGIILIAAVGLDQFVLKRASMYKPLCLLVLFSCIFSSCEPPPAKDKRLTYSKDFYSSAVHEVSPDEEYVMVTPLINLPMYVDHDQKAFKAWAEKAGVKISILGPSEWDIPAQIQVLEQVISTRPAGLLINGTDPGIATSINKAVAAGIPTVVYDSEVKSNRHCFIGSDWYEMGRLQGERMAKLIGGKGKVACFGVLGISNQEAGFQGVLDVIKRYPEIEFVGKFDDKANLETATKLAADLLSAYPDLAGFLGFDSESGPGIAIAVKEAGKAGKVKITSVDTEPPHLQLVKEGVIQYLVGQKRELFTWYGAQFLFDMVHRTNRFSNNDQGAGIAPVPDMIVTGSFEVDASNIDLFIHTSGGQ